MSGVERASEVANATKISPLPWWATEPVREAEAGATRDALELCGRQRQVGGKGDDAAPCGRDRLVLLCEQAADRYPGDAELARGPEVRQEEHADGAAGHDPARRADAALPPKAAHAGPGADRALGDRPARGGFDRPARVSRLDLDWIRLVQVAVVALADDGD